MQYERPGIIESFRVDRRIKPGAPAPRAADWRVQRLQDRITASHGSPGLTLAALSTIFGLTPSHLGKRFKQEVGIGFRSFMINARIEHAAALLRGTKLSMKQIAVAVGYEHAGDFDYRFKKIFGVSPNEYRQRHYADAYDLGKKSLA